MTLIVLTWMNYAAFRCLLEIQVLTFEHALMHDITSHLWLPELQVLLYECIIRVHLQNNMWFVLLKVRGNDPECVCVWDRARKAATRITTKDDGERTTNIMESLSLFQFCSDSLSLTVRSLWGQTCVTSPHRIHSVLFVCTSAYVFA